VDDEVEARQVDAAGRDVGGDADAGATVAHGLQRVAALVLCQFAGQCHDVEIAVMEARGQMIDGCTRRAEHDGVGRFVVAQNVDDGILAVARGDGQRTVFDIDVLLFFRRGRDAHGVLLVALGELGNGSRHGCREHQRAALGRCGVEDEFQVFAEAEVEHLVGFVEDGGLQFRHVERAAADVVAEAARRADDDMGTAIQRAALGADVHAADAADDHGAGQFIEPFEFAGDLQGQFACRRDDQCQRCACLSEAFVVAEQCRRQCQAEGHGLAGTGLSRDECV
jgi:hypothetical protein